jgi:hypothetical protein
MTRLLSLLILFTLFLATFGFGAQDVSVQGQTAKGWRGLVPLQATRSNVEKLLGAPDTPGGSTYEPDGQYIYVEYSDGPCEKGWPYGWNVEKDTVTSIWVSVKERVLLSDLKIEESKYQKYSEGHIQNRVHYVNYEEGIDLLVDDTTIGMEIVKGFYYMPTTSDETLRCPDAKNRLPAGRKQADSFAKFDVYGDLKPTHERYRLDNAASYAVSSTQLEIYIIAYAGREAHPGEAETRASCARDYLIKEHRIGAERIRAIDGGYRDQREVEIYVEPKDGDIPLARPSLRPSKVRVAKQKNPVQCLLTTSK